MSRSKWKGPLIRENSLTNLQKSKKSDLKTSISRDTTILPSFINGVFKIHNGKEYDEVTVTDEMIGHKFGEFSFTRKRFSFKKKKR